MERGAGGGMENSAGVMRDRKKRGSCGEKWNSLGSRTRGVLGSEVEFWVGGWVGAPGEVEEVWR